MITWNEYKNYVKENDPEAKKDIEEAEMLSAIIGAMLEQRKQLGLSQRELAEKCGIPQSTVARIESYRTTPNLNTLLRMMHSLGLQLTVTHVNS
ncbi:MAG: helix-turn-helix transcriptional regulator [Oscillospiraceae bacterium]|nr:helix-turn-helix transcriptional regulator [Oscillospiraceae bacterium]